MNRTKLTVRDLEVFKRPSPDLRAGDRGGAFVKLKADIAPKRGAVIYEPSEENLVSKTWRIRFADGEEGEEAVKTTCPVFHGTHMEGSCLVERAEGQRDVMVTMKGYGIMARRGDPLVVRNYKDRPWRMAHIVDVA